MTDFDVASNVKNMALCVPLLAFIWLVASVSPQVWPIGLAGAATGALLMQAMSTAYVWHARRNERGEGV